MGTNLGRETLDAELCGKCLNQMSQKQMLRLVLLSQIKAE